MEALIIIGIAVLGIILRAAGSAARKNNRANNTSANTGEGEQQSAPPPRMSTMSDIQKAFMMMSDEEPKKAPAPTHTRPMRPAGEGYGSHEGTISHEGRIGSEGLKGKHEGIKGMHEGTVGRTEGKAFHPPGFHSTSNKYAKVDLKEYTHVTDSEDQKVVTLHTQAKRSPLKLFEDKDDFTKAVIYSEILSRKPRRTFR